MSHSSLSLRTFTDGSMPRVEPLSPPLRTQPLHSGSAAAIPNAPKPKGIGSASDVNGVLAARLKACAEEPYYAATLQRMRIVYTTEVPFMAVDAYWRVYINPHISTVEYKGQIIPVGQVQFIWLHELWHLLLDHHTRAARLNADQALWNIAADISINQPLREKGKEMLGFAKNDEERRKCFQAPEWCLFNETYNFPPSLTAEEYYALAKAEVEKNPNGKLAKQAESMRERWGQGQGNGSDDPLGGGSSADGVTRSWERGAPSDEKAATGEKTGMDQGDAMQYRRMVAEEMKQYEQKTKNEQDHSRQQRRGTLPAYFKRWADATLAPAKVPWQTKMRGMVRNSVAIVRGMTDYSRRQPNRRQAAFGNIILSSHTQPVPRVFVGIDTSGSMNKEWLEKAVVEVGGILKATGVNELEFAAIDTMIHVAKRIRSVREIDLRGGGGTDMNPAMDYAALHKFDICIILTDGWVGSWGNPRKNLRVIAGLVQPECEKPPAWVDSVYIDD